MHSSAAYQGIALNLLISNIIAPVVDIANPVIAVRVRYARAVTSAEYISANVEQNA